MFRINIPSCLKLSEFEEREAQNFATRMYELHAKAIHAAVEEDCCGMSPFYFEITGTGICDQIVLCYGKERHLLNDLELF